ncbi:MAG TPA: YHS domain-containing protein [Pirellulales bacterium]
MIRSGPVFPLIAAMLLAVFAWGAEDEAIDTAGAMDGLRKFQGLIGGWRASSQGQGPKGRGIVEDVRWRWKFNRDELPALEMTIEGGDLFRSGLLRYDPESEKYMFVAQRVVDATAAKPADQVETVIYEGKETPSEEDRNIPVLSLSRRVPGSRKQEQVVIRLQEKHHYVFQLASRTSSTTPFQSKTIFSVTREGESIAALDKADSGPVCIVSGGLGTSSTVYKGVTYYFCCSGCVESFKDNPDKYIAEAAAAAKKAKDAADAKKTPE